MAPACGLHRSVELAQRAGREFKGLGSRPSSAVHHRHPGQDISLRLNSLCWSWDSDTDVWGSVG